MKILAIQDEFSLEKRPCTVCGSKNSRSFCYCKTHWPFFGQKFEVARCQSCGSLYMSPRLIADDLAAAYSRIQDSSYSAKLSTTASRSSKYFGFTSWLKKHWHALYQANSALKYIDGGPVLDVGCGQGDLLSQLEDMGIDCAGIEFSEPSVAAARERGLRVVFGNVEDISAHQETLGGNFRYIVLSHVLEHLPDPVLALQNISKLLSKDGSLIVIVPNANSGMRFLFGKHWHGWDPPFHLTHFTTQSLKRVGSAAGLKAVSAKTKGGPDDLNRSLDLLLGKKARRIGLRVATIPLFFIFGFSGLGPHIEMVFIKSSQHESA